MTKKIMAEEFTEKIRCVVFDLDDTLTNERDYCKSGFKAVSGEIAGKFGRSGDEIYNMLLDEFNHGDREKIFNKILNNLKLPYDRQYIKLLVEKYRTHIPSLKLPLKSRFILDELRPKTTLGLLTDGFLPAQRLKVEALGIADYFDAIVYTELLGRENWKPSTAGFEVIMRMTKFPASSYVYVGDNPAKDFIAPNKLDWKSVWYRNAQGVHQVMPQTEDQRPQFEINELSELLDIFEYGD